MAISGIGIPVVRVVEKVDNSKANETSIQAEALAMDVEKLYMITEALWSIIKFQSKLTDDHLSDLIAEIDMRSGRLDGRRKREERPDCQQCGKKMISKSTTCLYCGTVAKLDPFKKY
jgi:hypothetical protein